jgi:hypothetical protein
VDAMSTAPRRRAKANKFYITFVNINKVNASGDQKGFYNSGFPQNIFFSVELPSSIRRMCSSIVHAILLFPFRMAATIGKVENFLASKNQLHSAEQTVG